MCPLLTAAAPVQKRWVSSRSPVQICPRPSATLLRFEHVNSPHLPCTSSFDRQYFRITKNKFRQIANFSKFSPKTRGKALHLGNPYITKLRNQFSFSALNPAERTDGNSAIQANERDAVGFLIDLRLRIPLEARMEKGEVR
jgi:hypothetical protein